MRMSSSGFSPQLQEEKKVLNSELWHACAGPLVSLPAVGSRVVYFPQGHSEQVAASTNKEVDAHIPNHPSLPPQLICQLHNLTMHADIETDEVYAQMTLQPLNPQEQKDSYLPAELGNQSKQPTNYFCKTLTASDTSTHGGFSVPRRAAEKVFPPLDFTQQPPAQELIARDLHDNEWKFRHIFRGQPKRHLLTTGWSVFVSAKRLVAGDSVLFIWNEKNQLFLGIRRANRPQTVMPSSVLSSDSMHLGLLAAAAHAAATNSRFTIFYNPRACPSEFVIPLIKYVKAVYHTRVSVGMRFRMLFETEESSVRRYMGTITGISDMDSVRWVNSHWRSVKVGWDESTAGERQPRVSLWEIEPLTTFPMYPSTFPLRLKRPWPSGLPSLHGFKQEDLDMNSPLMWLRGDSGIQAVNFQGMGITPWMQPRLDASMMGLQTDMYQAMAAAALQEMRTIDPNSTKLSTPSLLQFQQTHGIPNGPSYLMQPQMFQQAQSQQTFAQGTQVNQAHAQEQTQGHIQAQAQAQIQAQVQAQAQAHQRVQAQAQVHQQTMHQQAQAHQQTQAHQHAQTQVHQQAQAHAQAQAQAHQQTQAHQHAQTQMHQQAQAQVHQQAHAQVQAQTQALAQAHAQAQARTQSKLLPQHAQQQQSFNSQQQQPSPDPPQRQQQQHHQQIPTLVSNISQMASTPHSLSPYLNHQQSISDSSTSNAVSPLPCLLGSYSREESSHLLNMPRTSPIASPSAWPSKRMAVDPLMRSTSPHNNMFQNLVSLPPFPSGDSSLDQVGSDLHSHTLFGVNIDPSSFLMQNGMPNLRAVGDNDSTTIPFASNFMSTIGSDFPLNPALTPSSGIDDSGYLQSPEDLEQANPPTRTFVKVYKSGSFGRSLDMAKFSSYQELRTELGRMFGLEGQLEDPLRSGWQLVFVDRENDVLLLGDDPWPEFVNSVWCIKILSPQEVQQMGKQGLDLLSSLPVQKLTNSSCEDFVSRQDSRTLSNGITSVGSLDYGSI